MKFTREMALIMTPDEAEAWWAAEQRRRRAAGEPHYTMLRTIRVLGDPSKDEVEHIDDRADDDDPAYCADCGIIKEDPGSGERQCPQCELGWIG